MAAQFKLSIITPEKVFFEGETSRLIVRTTEGDLGILARHTSLVSSLPSGPMRIMMEDGSFRTAALSSGFLKVGGNKVSIIANAVEWADEIDIEWAKRSEADARAKLDTLKDKHQLDLAELKLKRALNRISVHSLLK
ncbi:MAG: ATP synthase F1 subunit epsilon [Oscillospiraceae bacterium]|nr:ATP synthase F1 subunit epsilon [Oscillospiraceae bacterium]